ncbi:MAG: hypothetical protein ACREFQ_01060 [Stellaceae bacterium]
MWKPPQRVRFTADRGQVPSREAAAASRLYSPVRVGSLLLAQRTWVPAMVPWRAEESGITTDAVVEWYGRFARGRPGAIVVEATGIRDVPSGPLLRIGHPRFLPGFRRIVERVRAESNGETRLFIQLIDFLAIRRRPDPHRYFTEFLKLTERHRAALAAPDLADSELRARIAALPRMELERVLDRRELEGLDFGYRERVSDTHLPHIRSLPEILPGLFADAAALAREAGFDGVELHYAHAYTMASFLSATNRRADGYGGAAENRVRLPLEVYGAVRAKVGGDYVVGCRFLAEECIDGASPLGDTIGFGVAFARAGMDFLSLSRGGKFDDAKQPAVGEAAYPYTGRSGYECMPQNLSDERGPFGRNNEATAAIRAATRAAALSTPVVGAGGVHSFAMAERMLEDGVCDIVAAARQSLADPDWFRKLALGRGAEVRSCEYTNYCEGLDQKHKQVTCKLWDRVELDEPNLMRSRDGKRRLTAPRWE